MEITVDQAQGRVPVTIMKLEGDLEAKNFVDVIESGKEIYDAGARDLLLDLTDLVFLSSAGLASINIVTRMFRGEKTDAEDGWGTYKAIDRDRDSGMQSNVKLFNPSPEVDNVLDTVGFKQFFEIYTDLDEAVQSF